MKLYLTKTYPYKGKTIVNANDGISEYIFIVGEKKSFGSVADAKKYINGKPTTWSVLDSTLWQNGYNEAVDALVAEHNL